MGIGLVVRGNDVVGWYELGILKTILARLQCACWSLVVYVANDYCLRPPCSDCFIMHVLYLETGIRADIYYEQQRTKAKTVRSTKKFRSTVLISSVDSA